MLETLATGYQNKLIQVKLKFEQNVKQSVAVLSGQWNLQSISSRDLSSVQKSGAHNRRDL